MSQQHTQQPAPGEAPPPKKRRIGRIAGLGCAGVVALFAVVAIGSSLGGSGDPVDTGAKDKAVAAGAQPGAEDGKDAKDAKEPQDAAAERPKSQAEEFRACVADSGTPTEKRAAEHVTKVTGADRRNDILDSAEVFTDFTGGMMGPHQGEGKLIASAFASCYESDNGLVTVYDQDGELLATAQY